MNYTDLSIAVVCDNASFKMGGEAAIPLHYFLEYRKLGARCKLLTHARVQNELESILNEDQLIDVLFFEDKHAQRILARVGRCFPERLKEIFFYNAIRIVTEIAQSKKLRELQKNQQINLVHQPTPISPRSPSLINNVGCPVFIGPLNGGIDFPPTLKARGGKTTQLIINLGRACCGPVNMLFPAKEHAAALFVCNQRTRQNLPRALSKTPIIHSFDNGVELDKWNNVARSPNPAHFLCVSRLANWKGIDLAVRATLRLDGKAKLTVIGDGPERSRLEAIANEKPGLVTFTGFLTHQDIITYYNSATALIMPSLREAGGTSVMEAQASGVPVIALAWGGLMNFVDHQQNGLLIEVDGDESTLISGIAQAMEQLIEDPQYALELGKNAKSKACTNYGWTVKASKYLDTFSNYLNTGKVVHNGYQVTHC